MDLERAEEFCRSYGAASLKGNAAEIAGHYGFPFTAFALGSVTTFADLAEASTSVAEHLARISRRGVGTAIQLHGQQIVPIADHSALCLLTWSIQPANNLEPWNWTNAYFLREAADGRLCFEASIADGEIAEFLKRFPDFFTS